jgi:hypothetical protein
MKQKSNGSKLNHCTKDTKSITALLQTYRNNYTTHMAKTAKSMDPKWEVMQLEEKITAAARNL